jgi:hypothetical protein
MKNKGRMELFEVHKDRMPPDVLIKFELLVWPLLKQLAVQMGVQLIDMAEIQEQMEKFFANLKSEDTEPILEKLKNEQPFDFQVKATNHATGTVGTITMAVKVPKEVAEQLRKRNRKPT